MFSLKTMFRIMIETSTKSAWWTILFKLRSIIMHVILMVLIIVMASVIASSTTTWSMKVTTMATATSASIIAVVIIIIIATMRRIKLFAVALELASKIFLLSPYPLLRPSIWLSAIILVPVRSTTFSVTSIILIVVVGISIFILFFLFRGRWLRLLLWFCFAFTFLSSVTSSTLEWFRYTCGVLILRLCYMRI